MKFGQNLHRYQIVEWSPFYIDYPILKHLYKAAKSIAVDKGQDVDLTDFEASLQQNLSKARSFYRDKHESLRQKVKALHDFYGVTAITDLDYASELEAADLEAALVELRDSLKRLLWYWVVNFDRTLSALVKFQEDLALSSADLDLRAKSVEELCQINKQLARIRLKLNSKSDAAIQMPLLRRKFIDENLFQLPLANAFAAIERDDTIEIDQELRRSRSDPASHGHGWPLFLFELLHFSITKGSQRCTARLLSDIGSIEYSGYHIHRLVSRVGRNKSFQGRRAQAGTSNNDSTSPSSNTIEAVDRLVHTITKLGSKLEKALETKDSFGKIPLHYAAQYDMPKVCREILEYMGKDPHSTSVDLASPALISDEDGLTAFDLAVLNGNATIMEILLEDQNSRMDVRRKQNRRAQNQVLPGHLLTHALRLNSIAIVRLLRRSVINVQYKDYHGNTALHIAVRSGKMEYVSEVLEAGVGIYELELDAHESVYGWTPLILASTIGDLSIVELLLRAGADPTLRDHIGWRAKDHAAFRGWLPMAKKLGSLTVENSQGRENLDRRPRHQIAKYGLSANLHEYYVPEISPSQSQIYINIGAIDTYKPIVGVDMSHYVWPELYDPQREADFYVEIRAVDGDCARHVARLPILEDMVNKPWRFVTNNAKNFKVAFDIYHSKTSAHTGDSFIGSAVALLDSLKQGLGPTRESLIRNFTIPVLQKGTLDFIGTVTFYFLVMSPFPHPDPQRVIQQEQTFPSISSPPIIGHRGIGENDPGRRQLQIGENTIESFLSAKELGASYIEFDVQLTKDDVPIIYHDFLMSETGIDAPLHDLNLEQFMYISNAQSTEEDLQSTAERRYLERCSDPAREEYRQRSYSVNAYDLTRAKSLIDRMKHTFEFKLKESRGFNSYKGNIRSEYIQASFATLEGLLTKLPESVRFDIEIKYPMLFESHDWGMETSAVEVNHLVNNILDRVYRLAKNRTIFFSSFSPEICILLSNKQHIYPVFFLTEAGHIPSSDARADSLQEAIWFAKSWRLAGVISRSEPLVISPQLIEYVKSSGLLCISWGGLNDVAEHVKTQADAGLDAIITNSVKLVSQTLKGA